MNDITITTLPERRTKPLAADSLAFPGLSDVLGGERSGWYAVVTTDVGLRLHVSKLDGEGPWTIDTLTRPNGFPEWSRGFGSRLGLTHTCAADIGAALDEAVAA